MINRAHRRKVRSTFFYIFVAVAIVGMSILLFFIYNYSKPFFSNFSTNKNKIIKPVADQVNGSDLKTKLSDKNINMESFEEASSSGSLIGKIKNGPKVYFSKTKDTSWQVNSLILILSKLEIDNKTPTLIDLRYERPIVKF